MKKAKLKFYRLSNTIIFGLLTLLGFASSCKKDPDSTTRIEYGTPHAKFIVNGTVTSADSDTPIKNIRAVMGYDTTFTDNNGKYHLEISGFPEDQTYNVEFEDIDSVENGEYNNLETIVKFTDPKFTNGDGHWYEGETSKELNAKLKKK